MKNELVYDEEGRLFVKSKKGVEKLSFFTNHYYSLRVINGIPILEIDGVRMHLVKNFNTPLEYAKTVCKLLKIRENDIVLDICGGLGYTSIEASKKAGKIVSIEKSKDVLKLAKKNPYSKEYFDKSKIKIITGDAFEEIKNFKDNEFNKIIHDPPRMNFAPELYSLPFYQELYRILKPNGILYHYVGFLGKRKGRKIEERIGDKLKEAGFKLKKYNEKCYGWLVEKS